MNRNIKNSVIPFCPCILCAYSKFKTQNSKLLSGLFFFLFLSFNISAQEQSDSIAARKSLFIIPNASYQQETSWAFGVSGGYYFKSTDLDRISSISGSAYYTLLNQFSFNITPKIFFKGGKYYLYSSLNIQNSPDFYYGTGNTPRSLEQPYTSQNISIVLQPYYAVTRNLLVGGILSFRSERVKTDDTFEANKQYIFDNYGEAGWKPYSVTNIGATVMYDTRDNHFYPYRGIFAKATLELSQAGWLSDYSLQHVSFDVRQFVPLFNDHVWAWQVYAKGTFGRNGIPFQLLPTIGGRDVVRGFRAGMYRDNILFAAQTEYRIPIYKRLKAATFIGTGDVLSTNDYKVDKLKFAYGAGLRFRLNDARVHFRVDLAKNNYNNKLEFYITATEAF